MTTERIQLPLVPPPIEGDGDVRRRATVRARRLGLGLVALIALVGLRGAQLGVYPDERITRDAAVQRWDTVVQEAPRGEILDRSGHRLAVSRASATVIADPQHIPAKDVGQVAAGLAGVLGGERADFGIRLAHPKSRYQRLATDVHPRVAKAAQQLHGGIYVEEPPVRFYPEGSLASHLIGFVNFEGTGTEGLEAVFESHLQGGVLVRTRRRDRRGYSVDDPTRRRSNHAGMTVHLTIDRTVQHVVERALARVYQASAPQSASAVVVQVASGDVLALANVPSFDPNHVSASAPDGPTQPGRRARRGAWFGAQAAGRGGGTRPRHGVGGVASRLLHAAGAAGQEHHRHAPHRRLHPS